MIEKVRILFAEDDINLGSLLRQYLIARGYETDLYADGEKAYKGFMLKKYDICVLDVMMPVKDGFTLAAEIRRLNSEIPILFLSAKSLKEDVLEGFKIGGDDYLTKPFNIDELLFRIEAILRRTRERTSIIKQENIVLGKYIFDTKKQILHFEDTQIKLTTKESELLLLLCNNKNKVLEKEFALKTIWIDDSYFNARSMHVYITKLRKYLKNDPTLEIINVHGKGYKLIQAD